MQSVEGTLRTECMVTPTKGGGAMKRDITDIPEVKVPDHIRRLFAKVPLVNISESADLSEESVEKFLKALEEEDRKLQSLPL